MQVRPRVLLVVPDPDAVDATLATLDARGIDVVCVDALNVCRTVHTEPVDLIVLHGDGDRPLSFLRRLRQASRVPILMLSDDGENDVFLQELPHRGRPVHFGLVERVRDLVRVPVSSRLQFDELTIDLVAHEVRVGDERVILSVKEFELLAFLACAPGHTYTRDELLGAVWRSKPKWQTTSTVTEHMRRLRLKVESDPSHPRWLITVRGVGYRLDTSRAL
ncbi:MAG: response regulator transcription factor [Actinomycetota bacterium]|nr:response regulator transcription factor [Actinomycetota bacterium]